MNIEKIYEDNKGLVITVVNDYYRLNREVIERKNLDKEDIYQTACEAFCKAVKKYDKNKAKFSTYAVSVMKKTINRYVLEYNRIKLPRTDTLDGKVHEGNQEKIKILRQGYCNFLDEQLKEEDKNKVTYLDHLEDITAGYGLIEILDIIERNLDERQKKILKMHIDNINQNKIAEQFNTSQVQISKKIKKIKKILRKEIA